MVTRPAPVWTYPIKAAADIAVMLLGVLLATWPVLLLFVLIKIIL